MNQIKRLCYIFVAILGVTSAITTSSKSATDGQALTSPSPFSKTEYSSRLGVVTSEDNKKKETGFKPSVNFAKFAQRNQTSTDSASSTSPQLSYPDNSEEEAGKSTEKRDDGSLGPQSVVDLQLLDENEQSNENASSEKESKGDKFKANKFPRIYYGEVSPPYTSQHPIDDIQKKNEENSHTTQLTQEEQPKYYYPNKNHGGKQGSSKKSKSKKKRFEYKHDERQQTPQDSNSNYHGPEFQDETYGYHGHNNMKNNHEHSENGYGHESEPHGHHMQEYGSGHEESHHGGSYKHEEHKAGNIIGKALQVLIPSALFLTGVSALFPNRIHVPTNDYSTFNQNNQNIRHKRSIDYNNYGMNYGPSSQILGPEHRSIDDDGQDIGFENIGRYGDYVPIPVQDYAESHNQNINEFQPISNPNEISQSLEKGKLYGQKTESEENYERRIISRPSTPQEYDEYNYGPKRVYNYIVSEDSAFEPNSPIPTPMIPPELENLGRSVPEPTPTVASETKQSSEETPRKRRVRIRQGVRSKIRSRPLPTPQNITANIQDFQPLPSPSEISLLNVQPFQPLPTIASTTTTTTTSESPATKQISQDDNTKLQEMLATIKSNEVRPGDAYLRSLAMHSNPLPVKEVDLSPDGPVMGLITSYAQHDQESPNCQKRALCELAIKGKNPNASKFETFLWSLATLVPDQFSKIYELEDIFKAIRTGDCHVFECNSPNIDLQM